MRKEFRRLARRSPPTAGGDHEHGRAPRPTYRRGQLSCSARMFDAGWLLPGHPPEFGGRNGTTARTVRGSRPSCSPRKVYRSFNPQGLGIIAAVDPDVRQQEQKRAGQHRSCRRDHRGARDERAGRRQRPCRPAEPGRARGRPTSSSTGRRCGRRGRTRRRDATRRAYRTRRAQAPRHRRVAGPDRVCRG